MIYCLHVLKIRTWLTNTFYGFCSLFFHYPVMGNFYLQYQYALPVFSDKALSFK